MTSITEINSISVAPKVIAKPLSVTSKVCAIAAYNLLNVISFAAIGTGIGTRIFLGSSYKILGMSTLGFSGMCFIAINAVNLIMFLIIVKMTINELEKRNERLSEQFNEAHKLAEAQISEIEQFFN